MLKRGSLFIPRQKSKFEELRERNDRLDRLHRIKECATESGILNLPRSTDPEPDETQLEILRESASFIAEVSRLASAQIQGNCSPPIGLRESGAGFLKVLDRWCWV